MGDLASTILTVIFGLGTFACSIYLLYILAREKGGAHAVLGFFFPPYAYVWGWIHARRLQILDVMVFWTLISIAAIAFPIVMGLRAFTSQASAIPFNQMGSSFDEEHVLRGPISRGSEVSGQIHDLFGVEEWTYDGQAGEQISIWCAPASGSETDPRITIISPDGTEIGSDDDSGGGYTAYIQSLTLPVSGTYRVLVDVWSTGSYTLSIE